MNAFSVDMLLRNLPNEILVSEEDKDAWLNNPCTAVHMFLCIKLIQSIFHEHLNAKNMNDVCETRGAYKACAEIMGIPSRIKAVPQDGLQREQASAMMRKIEDLINESRADGNGSAPDDAGDPDDDGDGAAPANRQRG